MTDNTLAPTVHPDQGEMLDRYNNEKVLDAALPDEPINKIREIDEKELDNTYGAWGNATQEERDAASEGLLDIHRLVKANQNKPENTQQNALLDTAPEDEGTKLVAELSPLEKVEMCDKASLDYFGVHTTDFAKNYEYWVTEYEKDPTDKVYRNKIWLISKLIIGNDELKALVENQAKLEEIANRL